MIYSIKCNFHCHRLWLLHWPHLWTKTDYQIYAVCNRKIIGNLSFYLRGSCWTEVKDALNWNLHLIKHRKSIHDQETMTW